jgi:hypothetical protein
MTGSLEEAIVNVDDDETMYHLGEGCTVHGDAYMTECAACGAEFCTRCTPGSRTCPDCSEAGTGEDEPDEAAGGARRRSEEDLDLDDVDDGKETDGGDRT